jgi:hypothetical protein
MKHHKTNSFFTSVTIQPRLLRFRDAPRYVGMNRNEFNVAMRPYLTVIPIGKRGIAFDRLELDALVDHHKAATGRPPQRRAIWHKNERQG